MRTPFMSIVLITYNGETVIERALQSLVNQDYPKDKYEIIVIDDGSTDRTAEIVQKFPVQYFKQQNQGIASARTAGLQLAHGDVYVCFDDDCYVEKDWLSELARGYESDNPIGVGGTIAPLESKKTLAHRYIEASNIEPAERTSVSWLDKVPLVNRFVNYILSNFRNNGPTTLLDKSPVDELYGLNASFDMKALWAVGGWDVYLSGIEDRAISKLLKLRFPDRQMFVMRRARIHTQPDVTIWQYVLRPFKRGIYNARFHFKYRIFPPIFPFPCLYLVLVIASLFVSPVAALIVIIAAPPLLYSWWIHYAVHQKSTIPILFAYVQLVEELMVITGLIRGLFTIARSKYARD